MLWMLITVKYYTRQRWEKRVTIRPEQVLQLHMENFLLEQTVGFIVLEKAEI